MKRFRLSKVEASSRSYYRVEARHWYWPFWYDAGLADFDDLTMAREAFMRVVANGGRKSVVAAQ